MKKLCSQLRLGNYVNVPREDQSPFRIDGFEYLYKDDCKVAMNNGTYDPGLGIGELPMHPLTWNFADLKPIPLTEEWLMKFGFEKFSPEHHVWDIKVLDHVITFTTKEMRFVSGYRDLLRCEYVHQIQNAFFALTGEELKINP